MNLPYSDPRSRGFQGRTPVEAVVRLLEGRVGGLAAEAVSPLRAAGRVLAGVVVAPVAVPGFDRAAMDGYAVRAGDTIGADGANALAVVVVGEALAGHPFAGGVRPGEAVHIMTGAPIPGGADAVVPVELVRVDGERVWISSAVAPGRHVSRLGEDVSPGQVVLPAGRRLRPQDVGLLAALGVAAVSVVRQPRVGIVVTGDELLPAGSVPEGYRVVDSNSVLLAALVERDGGLPHTAPLVPDRRDELRRALSECDGDVLLVSGGTSVGQEDHAPAVLAEVGELAVHGVALRPGGPAGVGFLGGRPVFLLPGNPVACLCAYDLFAGAVVRRLGGRAAALPYPHADLPLRSALPSAVGRVDYVRVCLRDGWVEPLAATGASRLSTATAADGFVLVPADRDRLEAGETVTVHLYDGAT